MHKHGRRPAFGTDRLAAGLVEVPRLCDWTQDCRRLMRIALLTQVDERGRPYHKAEGSTSRLWSDMDDKTLTNKIKMFL